MGIDSSGQSKGLVIGCTNFVVVCPTVYQKTRWRPSRRRWKASRPGLNRTRQKQSWLLPNRTFICLSQDWMRCREPKVCSSREEKLKTMEISEDQSNVRDSE